MNFEERCALDRLGHGLKNGYSRHLGGPWYIGRSPDTGEVSFKKDHGTGTHSVPLHQVPVAVRERAGLRF